jgi:hypothetical protein
MKSNQIDPNTIIKAAVTLTGIYLVYKVLQKIGVVPTAAANQAAQNLQQLEAANYWDYNNFRHFFRAHVSREE